MFNRISASLQAIQKEWLSNSEPPLKTLSNLLQDKNHQASTKKLITVLIGKASLYQNKGFLEIIEHDLKELVGDLKFNEQTLLDSVYPNFDSKYFKQYHLSQQFIDFLNDLSLDVLEDVAYGYEAFLLDNNVKIHIALAIESFETFEASSMPTVPKNAPLLLKVSNFSILCELYFNKFKSRDHIKRSTNIFNFVEYCFKLNLKGEIKAPRCGLSFIYHFNLLKYIPYKQEKDLLNEEQCKELFKCLLTIFDNALPYENLLKYRESNSLHNSPESKLVSTIYIMLKEEQFNYIFMTDICTKLLNYCLEKFEIGVVHFEQLFSTYEHILKIMDKFKNNNQAIEEFKLKLFNNTLVYCCQKINVETSDLRNLTQKIYSFFEENQELLKKDINNFTLWINQLFYIVCILKLTYYLSELLKNENNVYITIDNIKNILYDSNDCTIKQKVHDLGLSKTHNTSAFSPFYRHDPSTEVVPNEEI